MLLPSSNVPETARITAIHHADCSPRLTCQAPDGRSLVVLGAEAIRSHLHQLNTDARGGRQGLAASEAPLQLEAPIAALAQLPQAGLGGRVTILDTPGETKCYC
jgi:hypothetical protein